MTIQTAIILDTLMLVVCTIAFVVIMVKFISIFMDAQKLFKEGMTMKHCCNNKPLQQRSPTLHIPREVSLPNKELDVEFEQEYEVIPQPQLEEVRVFDNNLSQEAEDYLNRFFSNRKIEGRQNIYIGKDTYEKLSNLVYEVGGRKATLGSFVDSVLREHFRSHRATTNSISDNRQNEYRA